MVHEVSEKTPEEKKKVTKKKNERKLERYDARICEGDASIGDNGRLVLAMPDRIISCHLPRSYFDLLMNFIPIENIKFNFKVFELN